MTTPLRCLLLLTALALLAAAEPGPPAAAVPRAAIAPLVQAAEDDPSWVAAPRLALGPCRGQPADLVPPTTVSLLWEPGFLHLRYRCTDPRLVPAPAGGDPYKGDAIELFLDPVGDARMYAEFQGGVDGRTWDQLWLLTAEARSGPDGVLVPEQMGREQWAIPQWPCPGLRYAARPLADGSGWLADLAVPAKPLLHRQGWDAFRPMTLRANLLRLDYGRPQPPDPVIAAWAPVVPGRPHRSPQACGTLTLLP